MPKLMYVSGTRADYGLMRTTLKAIAALPGWQVSVVAVGAHLSPYHGETVRLIEQDGFSVVRVPTLIENDSGEGYVTSFGLTAIGLGHEIARMRPDVVLLLGDRGEMLAGAVAASAQNVLIAHVAGGDRTMSIDEPIRHAITQFAHLHFVANRDAAEIVRRLGAPPEYIFVVGAPGADETAEVARGFSKEQAKAQLRLPPNRLVALVVHHPVTTAPAAAREELRAILTALQQVGAYSVVFMPNSDPGYSPLRGVLHEFSSSPDIRIETNLERRAFLMLMRAVDVMVGNSSSGIIEAPVTRTPFVHVGNRQEGRVRGANVIVVADASAEKIREAIRTACSESFRSRLEHSDSPYGSGGIGKAIADILGSLDLNSIPRQRHYVP